MIHKRNLLVFLTEQNIIAADRKLVHHKDRVEVLEREGEKLNNLVEKEKQQIEAMEQIIDVLDSF